MKERLLIEKLRAAYPIEAGSRPGDITAPQQRARNIAGRLYTMASQRGKRRRFQWI